MFVNKHFKNFSGEQFENSQDKNAKYSGYFFI